MPQLDPTRELYIYRLAILSSDPGHVLARQHRADVLLPRVSIPGWIRPAAEIQKVIRDRWNLKVVILDFLYRSDGLPGCVVAQLRSAEGVEDWVPVRLDHLCSQELTDLERAIIEAISSGDAGRRGVFSRVGWVDEAIDWMRQKVGSDVRFTGEVEQHNASGTFALLRFGTQDKQAYWLKATGEPNIHELEITATLAEICPECLPPLIATRRDWNAWIMEDAGEPIDLNVNGTFLENAVTSMAKLQKATLGHTDRLLAMGATDQRMRVLCGHIGETIAFLEEAMERQTSTKVPRVTASRLRELGAILENACCVMEELAIPDTVIHNDLNPANILVRNDTCVFTDWSETCVGNPFITFQQFLTMLTRAHGSKEATPLKLEETDRRLWLDILAPWKIDVAFVLIPLLAPFSCLYGRGSWLQSAQRYDAHVEGYARSLARYIDRAAQSTSVLEALCD
jgi:hypothetical protein